MKTIRLIELFAGYGSQAMALKRLGVPFEHHFVCEFDKYAVASYNAVHGTEFEVSDIRDIHAEDLKITDKDKYNYLLTYSFPCTDLSVAGQMRGMSKGTGTRSGLLWEVERILKECGDNLPQFLMMENVPQVHGKKNIDDFNDWIAFLDSIGYKSKWQDLNAKDYGVAQNRDRCFMVSWLESGFCYQFPQPVPLAKTMRDYLDEEVDEKYYLKSEKAQKLIDELVASGTLERERERVSTLMSKTRKSLADVQPSEQVSEGSKTTEQGKRLECASVNYKRFDRLLTEGQTIAARDCKGFGSGRDTQNGVLESGTD